MDLLVGALRQTAAIVFSALRILLRHWPTLLMIFMVGAAGHGAFLWLAAFASKLSPLLANFVLPLASLSSLIALVFMLRTVAPSLPTLGEEGTARFRDDFSIAIQVLVPFLAIYASQGILRADVRTYLADVTSEEWLTKGLDANFVGRANFGNETALLVLAVAALITRKVLDAVLEKRPTTLLRGARGYLEALWLTTLAWTFASNVDAVTDWILERAAVSDLVALHDAAMVYFGPVGEAVNMVIGGPAGVLKAMGALVVVPVSWLAVGATVYGASLPDPQDLLVPPEAVNARINRIPNPIRRGFAQVIEPVVSPVLSTLKAISRVAVAGFLPMVFLCLTIAGAAKLRLLVVEVIRLALGPHPIAFWATFSPLIDILAQAVYNLVMVVLLAATVDVVIRSTRAAAEEAKAEAAQKAKADALADEGIDPVDPAAPAPAMR
ncbi:hypothetical protein I6B53_01330 [Schaalia sp. 19OD2882]|uniref:hypothetical protein n=1 Tax=Schaalia sp. 19OD2882 TaxID=2794089 RepID=UPI001C1EF089|nr:hypothetical protein [Schaalia sp. 19OD2882]QWW19805.1 hypothetical protein I6B53_01330 [Schaalia sp. 19OD2882]